MLYSAQSKHRMVNCNLLKLNLKFIAFILMFIFLHESNYILTETVYGRPICISIYIVMALGKIKMITYMQIM